VGPAGAILLKARAADSTEGSLQAGSG